MATNKPNRFRYIIDDSATRISSAKYVELYSGNKLPENVSVCFRITIPPSMDIVHEKNGVSKTHDTRRLEELRLKLRTKTANGKWITVPLAPDNRKTLGDIRKEIC